MAIVSKVKLNPTLSSRAPATDGPTICPNPPATLNIPEKLSLTSVLLSIYCPSTASSISGIIGIMVKAAPNPKIPNPIIISGNDFEGNLRIFEGPIKIQQEERMKNPIIIVVLVSNFFAIIGNRNGPPTIYEIVGTANINPMRRLLSP